MENKYEGNNNEDDTLLMKKGKIYESLRFYSSIKKKVFMKETQKIECAESVLM